MIAQAIQHFLPGSQFVLVGDTYDGLTWHSDSPKPTEAQVNDWIAQMPTILANKKRIAELKTLLSQSDYRMTTDYYNTMTQADQIKWTQDRDTWRTEVRSLESE